MRRSWAAATSTGLVLATGHYRNGVLLTPITAEIISTLIISGELESVAEPFTLDRFATAHWANPMIIRVNGQLREVDPPVRLSDVLDLAEMVRQLRAAWRLP